MKTNKILFGLAACIAMLACSEDKAGDSGRIDLDEEGQAYLKVNISDAGSTRATGGAFDNGNVCAEGKENTDQGIEYMGNSVVVLKGLKNQSYPKYMVTVLNAPDKFEPKNTLKEMKEVLAGGYKSGNNLTRPTTRRARRLTA